MTNILPYHPHPKENELFSSWLVRLAKGLGIKLHSLTQILLPGYPIWNRDIDRSVSQDILVKLAHITGIQYIDLFQTTLRAYEGYAFEKLNYTGNSSLLCPVGVWHRKRTNFGLSFCPHCLAEDKDDPYFRRTWRLSIYVSCTKHKLQLLDRCSFCGAAVVFHRNDFDNKETASRYSLDTCYQCKIPLSNCIIKEEADPVILETQQSIENMIVKGWTFVGSVSIYAFLFLRIFKHLMRMFVSKTKECEKLRQQTNDTVGLLPITLYLKPEIDHLPVAERRIAFKFASWLLSNWPNRFIDVARKASLSRTPFVRDMIDIPFWFDQQIHCIDGRSYDPSPGEITSAIRHLEKTGKAVNYTSLCKTLGLHDSKNVRKYLKKLTSQ